MALLKETLPGSIHSILHEVFPSAGNAKLTVIDLIPRHASLEGRTRMPSGGKICR